MHAPSSMLVSVSFVLLTTLFVLFCAYSCQATVIGSRARVISCSRVVDVFVGENALLEVGERALGGGG